MKHLTVTFMTNISCLETPFVANAAASLEQR